MVNVADSKGLAREAVRRKKRNWQIRSSVGAFIVKVDHDSWIEFAQGRFVEFT
jgi:hypothetical protein